MGYDEETFNRLFRETVASEAAKQSDYWSVYFAPRDITMAHDSAPLEIRFTVDVRALKRKAGA